MWRFIPLVVLVVVLAACAEGVSLTELQGTVEAAVDSALAEAGSSTQRGIGIDEGGADIPASALQDSVAPPPAPLATRAFLTFEGIEGEAQDQTHGGEIDVLSWGWELTQSGGRSASTPDDPTGGVPGTAEGDVQVGDFVITKYFDKASPKLAEALANGQVLPVATLTIRSEGEKPLEYILVTFTDGIVTSTSTGGTGGDRPVETITLNFTKVAFEYQAQDRSGAPQGPPTGFEVSKTHHDTAMASIRNLR